MDDKTFTCISLCKSFINSINGNNMLLRLADLQEDKFVEYNHDKTLGEKFQFRGKFYYNAQASFNNGEYAIYRWTATPHNKKTDSDFITIQKLSESPIELIEINNIVHTDDKYKDFFLNGIQHLPDFSSHFIFYNKTSGVYCKRDDFELKNNINYLTQKVHNLKKISIKQNDIIKFDDHSFYRMLTPTNDIGKIQLQSEMQIIKELFLNSMSWAIMKENGFTRAERQKIKDFISIIPNKTFVDNISNECNIEKTKSELLIKTFISNIGNHLSIDDIEENKILVSIIENHPAIIEKYASRYEKRWRKENQQILNEHNHKLAELSKDYELKNKQILKKIEVNQEQLNKTIQEQESKKKQLEQEIHTEYVRQSKQFNQEIEHYKEKLTKLNNEIELKSQYKENLINEINSYEQIFENVKIKVKQQIEEAQNDASNFIAKIMLIPQTYGNEKTLTDKKKNYTKSPLTLGAVIEENEPYSVSNYDELLDVISENIQDIGAKELYADYFATMIYSAYIYRIPLILAGPGGSHIANAFSAVVYGKTADIIDCSIPYENFNEDELKDASVVIVKNPFSSPWIDKLPELASNHADNFFILVTPFIEDLQIEPKSLFNYFLPVFTDIKKASIISMISK